MVQDDLDFLPSYKSHREPGNGLPGPCVCPLNSLCTAGGLGALKTRAWRRRNETSTFVQHRFGGLVVP